MPKIADIEDTPNPNAVKFVLKDRLTWGTARSFDSAESAAADPLASQLFAIAHVTNVYYMDKWISVTQDGEAGGGKPPKNRNRKPHRIIITTIPGWPLSANCWTSKSVPR